MLAPDGLVTSIMFNGIKNASFLFELIKSTTSQYSGGSRGSTAGGGVTKSARSAAGGRVWEGEAPSCRWGSGGPPPGKFLKNGCKWCILSPVFAEFVSIFFPKNFVQFLPSKLRSSIYVKRENIHLSTNRRSYKAKEGDFLSSRSMGGGGSGVSPRKFLKNGCKWCILSPFMPSSCRFFPIICNFCFQISDLLYTWCGRIFTLAVEEKPKRGIFYLLVVWGDLPEKIFEKWMQIMNGAFWAHFCRVRVDLFPQNCV